MGENIKIKKIGVIGAGTVGPQIAQVCAMAGFEVVMRSRKEETVQRGMSNIEKSLAKFVEKAKITVDEKAGALARINSTTILADVKGCDIIIEAIIEKADAKKTLFRELDVLCPDAILATNTSTISITELASSIRNPARFLGMHFFNPVPFMKLVEIIKGNKTSPEIIAAVNALAKKLGKTAIEVKDYPGFIVNRILITMINEAIFCLYEDVASAHDIDNAMKLGANHQMGPLEIADLIGLDVVLAIMDVLYDSFEDPKYSACPMLREMVNARFLGRKTGQGFYEYNFHNTSR